MARIKATIKTELFGSQEVGLILPRKSRFRGGSFVIMFNDGLLLLNDLGLTLQQYRVILFLISEMGYNNEFRGPQRYIAESTKIAQPHVSRALKSLSEMGLIFREKDARGHIIRVSAVVCWKGDGGKDFRQQYAKDSEFLCAIAPDSAVL